VSYDVRELKEYDSTYIIRPWKVKPIIVRRGEGVFIEDLEGKRYIDTVSAFFVLNVGYSHPEVIAAVKEQIEKVAQTTTYQSNIPIVRLAKKLVEITPKRLNRVYYVVGGAETCETAVKMAKQYTGRREIITLKASYHGASTTGSATLTGITADKVGFTPSVPGVYHAAPPYCYRCQFGMTYPDCGLTCAYDIKNVLKTETMGDVAAVMVETIMGAGGAIIPPKDWLKAVKEICDENGLLLIVDEIQAGFGRSGLFWAFEHSSVEPDLLCVSKTLGGGFPLGAVVTSEEVAEKFEAAIPPTFAGNAVAAVAGLKTIEIIERERLWENAARMGEYFTKRFNELAEEHHIIGNVRFRGLMGGIELVKDRETKEAAIEEAEAIAEALKEKGILSLPGGISGSVFRIQPALNIKIEEAEMIIEAFDSVLP